MTADECRLILKQIFKKLYPNCTVQDSYPGDLPRPPLPYIVLDFGRVDTQKVDSSFNGKDGILYQSWHQSMPLTVELVSSSKTKHTDKEKLTSRSTVVDDLVQAVLFFQSPMARDIFTFLQGGDSIIGRLLEDAGVDVDELRENIHNFFEDAKAFGGEALDALRQFWEEHGQAVVGVLQWLWGVAVALIQVVLGLFHGVLDDSSEAWNDFLTGLDNLGAAVFGSLWDPMKESAQALWDWLTGFFDWIGDRVEQIRGAWTAVKNFFTGGSSEDEQDTDKTDSTKTRSSKWGGAGRSKSSDTDSKKAVSGFVSAGQAASSKTVNAPVSRSTKNITVRQENNQKYTFQVSDRQAADKLQREVSTQGTQSANQLAHTLNFGG